MPKDPRKIKKHYDPEFFIKVTSRTMGRFDLLQSEDKTNKTNTVRGVTQYSSHLFSETHLTDAIVKMSKLKGRKITILDSGCGECHVIDELLSNKQLEPHIEKIIGISKHYFENTKEVLGRHRHRFQYYNGSSTHILSKAPELQHAFDLILDVWGAYPYSQDKMALLKQYHAALKPGGSALIFSVNTNHKKDLLIKTDAKKSSETFFTWAEQNHPDTFKTWHNTDNKPVIRIEKSCVRWPIVSTEIITSDFKPAYVSKLTKKQLTKGNAMMFANVVVEPLKDQPMELRPLKYKN